MDFGEAIRALKTGKRVARAGWNGKGMHLTLVATTPGNAGDDVLTSYRVHVTDPADTSTRLGSRLLPWIGMKTADDCFVPWLASQTNVLAEDWEIVS